MPWAWPTGLRARPSGRSAPPPPPAPAGAARRARPAAHPGETSGPARVRLPPCRPFLCRRTLDEARVHKGRGTCRRTNPPRRGSFRKRPGAKSTRALAALHHARGCWRGARLRARRCSHVESPAYSRRSARPRRVRARAGGGRAAARSDLPAPGRRPADRPRLAVQRPAHPRLRLRLRLSARRRRASRAQGAAARAGGAGPRRALAGRPRPPARSGRARFSYDAEWRMDAVTPELAAASGAIRTFTGGAHGGLDYRAILIDRRDRPADPAQRAVRAQPVREQPVRAPDSRHQGGAGELLPRLDRAGAGAARAVRRPRSPAPTSRSSRSPSSAARAGRIEAMRALLNALCRGGLGGRAL